MFKKVKYPLKYTIYLSESDFIITFAQVKKGLMKNYVIYILLIVCSLSINAQAQSNVKNVHNNAHQSLLSNYKNPIGKEVLNQYLKEDIIESEGDLSEESSKILDDLLSEAQRYIGVKYRHGAKGPNAFDCSGYTSYIYRQFGYTLSPASRVQYTEGEAVARNELRKGDLVFFTSPRSGKNVGHVGIVVTADNETGEFTFIHASIKGVKISDCKGYYAPRYIGARRVITK